MTTSAGTAGETIAVRPRARPGGGGRRRWEVWRSPEGQPGWARPVLLVVAAFAAAVYAWNITASGYAMFYSDSVKSMSVSWKALLYGALDPGSTITMDKIPGAFVPQALSARLFGFHQWSVTLPQCVEGVVCVLVMYRVVRRWAGPKAGIIAAALFTCTPVCASMFGHPMEDSALTMCLVLAADRFQVAVRRGSLRSLVFCGVWVGVGFQAKMMQAWMVLPAFALAYLLVAPGRVRRRIWHLAVAGVVCLAVSVSWVAMMTAVPAQDRPYVDGSSDNSAVAMVFGYNGLARFGIDLPGALPSIGGGGSPGRPAHAEAPASTPTRMGGPAERGTGGSTAAYGSNGGGAGASEGSRAAGGAPFGGARGGGFMGMGGGSPWLKLLEGRFAPQISWTLPFALIALAFGLLSRRRAARTDVPRGGFVLWGAWLVVVGLVFSDMSMIPHTAYMATLAAPLAALCGAGVVLLGRAYRRGGRGGWVLPAAVAVQAGWTWYVWSESAAGFLPWLRWATLVCAVAGVLALVLGRLTGRGRARVAAGGLVLGLATAFAAPVAWSASAFDPRYDGSAFDASAGPSALGGMFGMSGGGSGTHGMTGMGGRRAGSPAMGGMAGVGGPAGAEAAGAAHRGTPAVPAVSGMPGIAAMTATASLTSDQKALWAYLTRHRDGAEYPLATLGWRQAEPYILVTGAKVLPVGGFSGAVPEPTLARFVQLVRQGRLRFVLAESGDGGMAAMFGDSGSGSLASINSWVTGHCTRIPAADYGVHDAAGGSGSASGTARAAMAAMFGGGTGTLYRCDRG